ncbi:GDSL esterase/lipase 4-like [Neltuma alba]|uniref:GDSL esterase/lipase 4-like n=1 Tax=Neltuma alba TaxID=207710 RepID=UPI0010A597BA|nr:GDSL esterase/lipase 4-like [Prosopis alba]
MARPVSHHISFFFFFFFFFSSTVLCLIFPTLCWADSSPCLQQRQTPPFIFGDSLSDPGNNNYINNTSQYRANSSPYGITFFKYPTGRFSDGRLVSDFITEFAELPLIPPYLQPGYHRYTDGANFASGGAGILVETNQGSVVCLKTQLEHFKNVEGKLRRKLGDAEARELVSRAVYLMNIGSNDYIFPLALNSSIIKLYPQKYVRMVIGNLTSVIKEMYEKGGRKFWVPNLAPFGCVPGLRVSNNSCLEEANALAKLHNQELPKMLQKLETQLKGFKYSTSDFYGFLIDMINFPSRHGLKEGKMACIGVGPFRGGRSYGACKDPSEYVFFDSVHPTETVNQKFASIVWNGNRNQTWPHNLKELVETI